MKKIGFAILFAVFFTSLAPVFSASYDNNEFQRKSRAYTKMAESAYDEGEYDAAVDYARLAEENALLSAQYIEKMLLRVDAQTLLYRAHTRLTWAKEKKSRLVFPRSVSVCRRSRIFRRRAVCRGRLPGSQEVGGESARLFVGDT